MILLDTGFIYALADVADDNHHRVRQIVERERGRRLSDFVITTNHILGEVLTLLRTRGKQDDRFRHARAVAIGRQIYGGAFGRLHQVTAEEEQAAFAYFTKYADKHYSFVDCTSFVIMEKLAISVAWSVDEDFTHRFSALPGPPQSEISAGSGVDSSRSIFPAIRPGLLPEGQPTGAVWSRSTPTTT